MKERNKRKEVKYKKIEIEIEIEKFKSLKQTNEIISK